MKKYVTLTEIAEQLGIPRTTVTEWKNQFDPFLPSEGEGRTKRYQIPDCMEIFQTISTLKQKDMSQDEITAILRGKYPLIIQEVQEQQPTLFLGLLDDLAADIKRNNELLERSNELKEKELLLRDQEIKEQQKFRSEILENLQRRNDDVTQTLLELREARRESAADSAKKRWWSRK
ncbi:MerR family transcriptional regulator [Paenibacillus odorifer]|uniref:MerR family transcriptional regulator n=1 Tax=Paenibacillus odorifer TaxID=189426 RepID=UPI00096BD87D|nr:MerR family transcriptional regulator [Paenibacillus odorifer]OMD08200.1 hypothetical protein BJP47_30060 [Paenibacillus odorifer]